MSKPRGSHHGRSAARCTNGAYCSLVFVLKSASDANPFIFVARIRRLFECSHPPIVPEHGDRIQIRLDGELFLIRIASGRPPGMNVHKTWNDSGGKPGIKAAAVSLLPPDCVKSTLLHVTQTTSCRYH